MDSVAFVMCSLLTGAVIALIIKQSELQEKYDILVHSLDDRIEDIAVAVSKSTLRKSKGHPTYKFCFRGQNMSYSLNPKFIYWKGPFFVNSYERTVMERIQARKADSILEMYRIEEDVKQEFLKLHPRQVNISGLDKGDLIRTLWNYASPAVAFQNAEKDPPGFDLHEAMGNYSARNGCLDYVCGRAIKTNIGEGLADPQRYNEYHGVLQFQKAVDALRREKEKEKENS
jgi:hypothetical protein